MKKITKALMASFLILVFIVSSFGQCWKQVSAGNNFILAIKMITNSGLRKEYKVIIEIKNGLYK
nr:hypothetical protein [uncultured Flavobacterium sp.]